MSTKVTIRAMVFEPDSAVETKVSGYPLVYNGHKFVVHQLDSYWPEFWHITDFRTGLLFASFHRDPREDTLVIANQILSRRSFSGLPTESKVINTITPETHDAWCFARLVAR